MNKFVSARDTGAKEPVKSQPVGWREPVEIENRRAMTTALLAKVEFDPFGGCWLWAYARLESNGYGRITVDGRTNGAHRVSWFAFKGQIPKGLSVLHRCDVRACINPEHLFLGTTGENNTDRAQKGRNAVRVGERNTAATLTVDDVLAIREAIARGARQRALAAHYGVSPATITDIKKGRSWTHI